MKRATKFYDTPIGKLSIKEIFEIYKPKVNPLTFRSRIEMLKWNFTRALTGKNIEIMNSEDGHVLIDMLKAYRCDGCCKEIKLIDCKKIYTNKFFVYKHCNKEILIIALKELDGEEIFY